MNNTEVLHKISDIHNSIDASEYNQLIDDMKKMRLNLAGAKTARLKFAISIANTDNKFGDDIKIVKVLEKNDAFDPKGDFGDSSFWPIT